MFIFIFSFCLVRLFVFVVLLFCVLPLRPSCRAKLAEMQEEDAAKDEQEEEDEEEGGRDTAPNEWLRQ